MIASLLAAQAQTVRPEVVASGLQHLRAVAFFCFSESGAGGNGTTLAPDGVLWTHEHGPQGGDEINLPQPGRNYGWPPDPLAAQLRADWACVLITHRLNRLKL